MNKFALIANVVAKIGPKVKGWIFADGKFQKTRAIIMLVGFGLIALSVECFGAANTQISLELLDALSDMIGYVE